MALSRDQLIEGYFQLRQQNDALRAHGHRFEALEWTHDDRAVCRTNKQGWGLRVYDIEGNIRACVLAPDGEVMTYSR